MDLCLRRQRRVSRSLKKIRRVQPGGGIEGLSWFAMSERSLLSISLTYNWSFFLLQLCRVGSGCLIFVLWMNLFLSIAGFPSKKRHESQCIRPTQYKIWSASITKPRHTLQKSFLSRDAYMLSSRRYIKRLRISVGPRLCRCISSSMLEFSVRIGAPVSQSISPRFHA